MDGEGRALIHLIEPMLPTPTVQDILAIGCGFLEVLSGIPGLLHPDGWPETRSANAPDVGCGCGRMSYMLAHYLDPTGLRDEGIDIVDHLIAWVQQTITPQFSNFRFQRADIYNN